jgi:hypothetical protein
MRVVPGGKVHRTEPVVITPQKFSGLSRNPRFPRGLKLLTKLLAIAFFLWGLTAAPVHEKSCGC